MTSQNQMFQYMTLNEFRKRYFNGKSRPSKQTVKSWIESGNNGVKLKAKFINGTIYISEAAALDFLAPTEQPRTRTELSKLLAIKQARIDEARYILKTKYGFNI